MKVVIGALVPSFITMRNTFSDNLPTNDFICMIIFLAISATLQAFPVDAWKEIGKYAGALTMVTFITLVAVCCGKAHGVGP